MESKWIELEVEAAQAREVALRALGRDRQDAAFAVYQARLDTARQARATRER